MFLPTDLPAFLITANAFVTVLESTSMSFDILFATKGSTGDEIDLKLYKLKFKLALYFIFIKYILVKYKQIISLQ